MKICVTSSGSDLDAAVDPRFGRAANFIFVNTDTMEFEVVPNPSVAAGGGAGIQSGQIVAEKGAEAVLTGNVGPNAFQTLNAGGIKAYIGISGTVKEAVETFKAGRLKPTDGSSVEPKFGLEGS